MHPTWIGDVGVGVVGQPRLVPGGALYVTVTSAGRMPSDIALSAAHVLTDQWALFGSSTGLLSLQSGLKTIWLTTATRAPCRAAFATVLYAYIARPRSKMPNR